MIKEFRNKNFFLSNFYNCNITYNGITYRNAEAAFQAQKTLTGRERFAELTPPDAKHLGRHVHLRPDWEEVKYDEMYKIVKAKFTQNEDLRTLLLATGTQHLEEGNTWGDRVWGTVNGVGENNLGKILMRIRGELVSEK